MVLFPSGLISNLGIMVINIFSASELVNPQNTEGSDCVLCSVMSGCRAQMFTVLCSLSWNQMHKWKSYFSIECAVKHVQMCCENIIYRFVTSEAYCVGPQIMKPDWRFIWPWHFDFWNYEWTPSAVRWHQWYILFVITLSGVTSKSVRGAPRWLTDRECESGANSRWMVWGLWPQW